MTRIGHFEGNARRRVAWMTLYGAAEQYRAARRKLNQEFQRRDWKPDGTGSECMFEAAYLTLERGITQYRRLQRGGSDGN